MEENNTDKFKTLKWVLIGVLIFSMLYTLFDNSRTAKFNNYKKTFKGEAIGLTLKFKNAGKSRYLVYCFYVNGKIMTKTKTMGGDEILNKFYKVKYDLNNPRGNNIFLDQELKPDSLTLVKNGFTWTKYFIYDSGITNKYLERSKWK